MAEKLIRETQVDLTRIDGELSRIDQRIDKLGKVFNYKGRVDSVDDLPEKGEETDLWLVGLESDPDKSEYFWTGTSWEYLGNTSNQNKATTDAPGIVELATPQEAEGGTDNEKALTPGSIKPVLDKKADLVNGKVPEEQLPSGSNNAVQKSGDTMTGDLIIKKSFPLLRGASSEDLANADGMCLTLEGKDKNNKEFARVDLYRRGSIQQSEAHLIAENASGTRAELAAFIDDSGRILTFAPTPKPDSNNTEIATTVWVRNYGINKSGDVMSGELTVEDQNSEIGTAINLKNRLIDRDVNPDKYLYCSYLSKDKNNKQIGNFYIEQSLDGTITSSMICTGRSGVDSAIRVNQTANGETSTEAPTPKIDSNKNEIATTEWVRNLITQEAAKFMALPNTKAGVSFTNSFTAPNNGIIIVSEAILGGVSTSQEIKLNENKIYTLTNENNKEPVSFIIPVLSGDNLYITGTGSYQGTSMSGIFYPYL